MSTPHPDDQLKRDISTLSDQLRKDVDRCRKMLDPIEQRYGSGTYAAACSLFDLETAIMTVGMTMNQFGGPVARMIVEAQVDKAVKEVGSTLLTLASIVDTLASNKPVDVASAEFRKESIDSGEAVVKFVHAALRELRTTLSIAASDSKDALQSFLKRSGRTAAD